MGPRNESCCTILLSCICTRYEEPDSTFTVHVPLIVSGGGDFGVNIVVEVVVSVERLTLAPGPMRKARPGASLWRCYRLFPFITLNE